MPLVDRFKYVTDGAYLTSICERYAKNKTNDLQLAWFNGAGFESWENVWGKLSSNLRCFEWMGLRGLTAW